MDEHGDYLFKYALSRLRDPLKAEDAVQEVFLVVSRQLGRFRGDARFSTWLFEITRRVVANQLLFVLVLLWQMPFLKPAGHDFSECPLLRQEFSKH